jgi:methenyltetrahydrofolate cyclohydrolase
VSEALDLSSVAARLGLASPPEGAGVLAAGVVAMAAGLCESIARGGLEDWGDARGAAVQAATLRERAAEAGLANRHAYVRARDALGRAGQEEGTGRDAALRAALVAAADTLLTVAAGAADCAGLAAEIAGGCQASLRADAVGAAELAAAAARSAAGLVDINLALLPSDERRVQVRMWVEAAEAARRRAREAADVG